MIPFGGSAEKPWTLVAARPTGSALATEAGGGTVVKTFPEILAIALNCP